MKAIVATKYGAPDVLREVEVEKPAPKKDEVLIKILAAPVTASDCFVRSGKVNLLLWLPMRIFVGFCRPRNPILGLEAAGVVEEVGKDIRRFKKGDEVIVYLGRKFGAYAEYVCVGENGKNIPHDSLLVAKPKNISFEEAACIPTRATLALYYLRKGDIEKTKNIMIYGASGGVGTFAVKLAKYFGANVTAVCGPQHVASMKSMGASRVIDYTKEYTPTPGEKYDLIFDAVGKKKSSQIKRDCKKWLSDKGRYICIDRGTPKSYSQDLLFINKLFERNHLSSIIDRTFSLKEAAQAHSYVEKGHKRGHVVLTP